VPAPAAANQYFLPTWCSAANPQHATTVVDPWDGRMEKRMLNHFIDPAQHTMRAVSKTQSNYPQGIIVEAETEVVVVLTTV